jgi:hypothetical protein
MGRGRFALLGFSFALMLALPTVGLGESGPPPASPPPGLEAAQQQCKAQGLTPQTEAFGKCVQGKLGGGQPPSGGGGAPPSGASGGIQVSAAQVAACKAKGLTEGTNAFASCVTGKPLGSDSGPANMTPAQQAGFNACKAKGIAPSSDAFSQCLKEVTATGPALTPVQQAATDACKAKGITQFTDAFKQCVQDALDAGEAAARLTPKQLAGYDACKAKGLSTRSTAFQKCLEAALTTKIPDNPKAQAEIEAAVAACNAKGNKTAALNRQCIESLLNKK